MVEIIGKYKINQVIDSLNLDKKDSHFANIIIFPDTSLRLIKGRVYDLYESVDYFFPQQGTRINNIRIFINNPDDIGIISESINKLLEEGNSLGGYELITSSQEYDRIMTPISSVKEMGFAVLKASFLFTIIFVSILMMFFLGQRSSEIGVYLAFGESYSKIIIQVILELLLVSLLAVSLSMLGVRSLSQKVTEEIATSLVSQKTEQNHLIGSLSSEDLIQEIKIEVNPEDIFVIYSITFGTVFISSLIPTILILRMKPKQILAL